MLFNLLCVLLVPVIAKSVELGVVILRVLAPFTALLGQSLELLIAIKLLLLKHLLVTLSVRLVSSLFQDELGAFFHGYL